MITEARKATLHFKGEALLQINANAAPYGRMYDSRSGLGAYYRYDPRRLDPASDDHGAQIPHPKIHESVIWRMAIGTDAYAPLSLPDNFRIVSSDWIGSELDSQPSIQLGASQSKAPQNIWSFESYGAAVRAQNTSIAAPAMIGTPTDARFRAASELEALGRPDEHTLSLIWDTVWWRKVTYFLTVAVTAIFVAIPFLPEFSPSNLLVSSHNFFVSAFFYYLQPVYLYFSPIFEAFAPIIEVLGRLLRMVLPTATDWWIDAFVARPTLVSSIVIAICAALACSSMIDRRIHDRSLAAWNKNWKRMRLKWFLDSLRLRRIVAIVLFGTATTILIFSLYAPIARTSVLWLELSIPQYIYLCLSSLYWYFRDRSGYVFYWTIWLSPFLLALWLLLLNRIAQLARHQQYESRSVALWLANRLRTTKTIVAVTRILDHTMVPAVFAAAVVIVAVVTIMAMREHFPAFALHDSAEPQESRLTTPLQIHDEAELVSALIGAFFNTDYKRRGLFQDIRAQIEQNAEDDPEPTLANYFAHTPFRAFSKIRIPITLFDETRFAGMWVIAPQGRGKTTLLHTLVAEDIGRDASIILMDSKGDLIEPFLTLASIRDRLVVIGPDNPVGLNPLDIPHTDINKAVDNLEYIFSSLLEFKLTPTQSMLLKAVLRALITVFQKPTLETFRDILANGTKKYQTEISQLEPDLQDFFYKEFETDNIRHRRQEVAQRLRLLLDHDIMRKMLLAPLTTFHIGKAMDEGKFIIIDNSKGKLGEQAAEFLGRFFVAQVLAAAQQRSFRPHSTKKPVYFYIDEAHTVIARDEKITTVLHECRSQKIALILAHQEMVQLSDHVLSAVQNCAIRFGNPDDEAPKLARSLRMDVETLRNLKRGQFAAFVRDLSKDGLVVNVERTDFSHLPQLAPPRPVLEIQAVQRQAQLPETHKPPETDGIRRHPHPRIDVPSIDNTGTPTAPAAQQQTTKAAPSSQSNAPNAETTGAADPGEPSDNW